MFKLARFFTHTRIDLDAQKSIISDIVEMIHEHTKTLIADGIYNELAEKVMQFKLNAQIFDVYGRNLDDYEAQNLLSTTDTDIDRQFRLAENKLGNEGIGLEYGRRYSDGYNPYEYKIDVILFASDHGCMDELNCYAKERFHALNDAHRRSTVSLPERFKKKYDSIVSDGDVVSKHNFRLPETIRVPRETEGKVYSNHLFVDDSGTAMVHLNGWESKVIEEEEKRNDFICWLRNPSRGSWALRLPYEINGEIRPAYPDFLIIRKDDDGYVVDILEPHDPTRIDNLGKAKGFAEYARQNPGVGRIQLIKMKRDSLGNDRPFRLDMSKSAVRDKVSRCISNEELQHIFDSDGLFD